MGRSAAGRREAAVTSGSSWRAPVPAMVTCVREREPRRPPGANLRRVARRFAREEHMQHTSRARMCGRRSLRILGSVSALGPVFDTSFLGCGGRRRVAWMGIRMQTLLLVAALVADASPAPPLMAPVERRRGLGRPRLRRSPRCRRRRHCGNRRRRAPTSRPRPEAQAAGIVCIGVHSAHSHDRATLVATGR
jgi:hypothetical protein